MNQIEWLLVERRVTCYVTLLSTGKYCLATNFQSLHLIVAKYLLTGNLLQEPVIESHSFRSSPFAHFSMATLDSFGIHCKTRQLNETLDMRHRIKVQQLFRATWTSEDSFPPLMENGVRVCLIIVVQYSLRI